MNEARKPLIMVIPPNELRAWLFAKPYFERALEHTDEWNIDDVAEQYCAGKIGVILCLSPEGTVFGALCAVKDNIDFAPLPTTAACPAFARQPAESAVVVAALANGSNIAS